MASELQSVSGLPYPKTLSKKMSKVVEAAQTGLTQAMFGTASKPSHVVKFVVLGSAVTGTTLSGLAVGDFVVRITAAGAATCKLCVSANTLPDDPADTDYIIVLRAAI